MMNLDSVWGVAYSLQEGVKSTLEASSSYLLEKASDVAASALDSAKETSTYLAERAAGATEAVATAMATA